MADTNNKRTPRPRQKRTIEDIREIDLDGQPAYSIRDAAVYLGVTTAGMQKIIDREGIQRWEFGYGTSKYVLKSDLDKLRRPRPVHE